MTQKLLLFVHNIRWCHWFDYSLLGLHIGQNHTNSHTPFLLAKQQSGEGAVTPPLLAKYTLPSHGGSPLVPLPGELPSATDFFTAKSRFVLFFFTGPTQAKTVCLWKVNVGEKLLFSTRSHLWAKQLQSTGGGAAQVPTSPWSAVMSTPSS